MPEASYGKSNRWLTVILISPQEFGADREQVRLALEAENIEARPLWKPMHLQPVFEVEASKAGKVKGKYKARVVGGGVGAFSATVPLVICIFAGFFFLGEGDVVAAVVLIALEGVGLGAWFFLAPAMLADVVDVDRLNTGDERAGLYFSVFSMVNKAGVALGVLVGTALPPLFGFEPSDPVHSEEAMLGFRAVFSFAGMPLALIAMLLFWNFPIDRTTQQSLRDQIEAKRRASVPAVN